MTTLASSRRRQKRQNGWRTGLLQRRSFAVSYSDIAETPCQKASQHATRKCCARDANGTILLRGMFDLPSDILHAWKLALGNPQRLAKSSANAWGSLTSNSKGDKHDQEAQKDQDSHHDQRRPDGILRP